MKKILLFILLIQFNPLVFSQNHLQKPFQEKALNDTIVFDLNQAVYSNSAGINYIEIPVILSSANMAINSFDFWFQFDLTKMTYESTTSLVTGLDAFSNYNSTNFYLSNTSSGTSITFNIPTNVPVIRLKFALANACTEINQNDFSNVTTLFDGVVSSYKFIAPIEQPIQLLSPDPLCSHNYIVFSYPSTIYGEPITNYSWDFANGQISSNQTDSTQYSFGSYNVGLTVTTADGCTHDLSRPITIIEGPQAYFTAYYDAVQNTQNFTNQSSITQGNITDYLWSFGDGTANSTIENPSHSYQLPGSYTVSLTVTSDNGCSNTYDSLISGTDALTEILAFGVHFAPNPCTNEIQISANKHFSGELIMEDVSGNIISRNVVDGQEFLVNVSPFACGVYTIRLNGNLGSNSFKVIKL